jgi:hypothetical protein
MKEGCYVMVLGKIADKLPILFRELFGFLRKAHTGCIDNREIITKDIQHLHIPESVKHIDFLRGRHDSTYTTR